MPVEVRNLLAGRGHEVVRAVEAGLGGLDDRSVAMYAEHGHLVVVTGNWRHFRPLVTEFGQLQVVTFRSDQALFRAGLSDRYGDVTRRLTRGQRWMVLRQVTVGRGRRARKAWIVSD